VTRPDRARVADMLWGFFPAQVLRTLAGLGVPDLLDDGRRDLAELAAATGCDRDALGRLLRAGRGLELVDVDGDGRWSLTADGQLLRTGTPGSLGSLAQLFCGDAPWRSWGELEWSVRTGEVAFEKVTGRSAFAHMADDPRMLAVFTEAMAEGTRMAASGIVETCDVDGVGVLVDVGGGNGTLLAAFLAAHPRLRGVLFDTAHGVGDAQDVLGPLQESHFHATRLRGSGFPATRGFGERIEIVTGDFFTAVPPADAYVVKSVVHDWDDERSVAILRRIREAMHGDARLFLVEPVLAEDTADLVAQRVMLMSDLNMLVCTGGRERTLTEFGRLLDAAGLRLVDVRRVPPPTGFSVLRAER
jgi:orsellinic acid C2-O-methyltransferase